MKMKLRQYVTRFPRSEFAVEAEAPPVNRRPTSKSRPMFAMMDEWASPESDPASPASPAGTPLENLRLFRKYFGRDRADPSGVQQFKDCSGSEHLGLF
jgi:hypothetical protein